MAALTWDRPLLVLAGLVVGLLIGRLWPPRLHVWLHREDEDPPGAAD